VHFLCGVNTTVLAASLPTLSVGLICHGSNEHVGENEMNLFTGGILFVGMISKSAPSSELSTDNLTFACATPPLPARGVWAIGLGPVNREENSLLFFLKTRYHSLLHLGCHLISVCILNLFGLISTKRGKKDLENQIIDQSLRMKK